MNLLDFASSYKFIKFMLYHVEALLKPVPTSQKGSFDSAALRSGFRQQAQTPAKRLKFIV